MFFSCNLTFLDNAHELVNTITFLIDKLERLRVSPRIENGLSVIITYVSRQLKRLKDHTSIMAIRVTRPRGKRIIHLYGINQERDLVHLSFSTSASLRSRDTPGYPEKSQSATRCGPLTSSYAPDLLSLLSLSLPLSLSLSLSPSLTVLLSTPERRRWYGVPYRRFTYI